VQVVLHWWRIPRQRTSP